MAGSGIGNVVGAVALQDFGTPRVLSMTAKENLSGGVLAFASGTAATVVSSGANSFAATDIEAAKDASGLQFTGIVLQDTASGSPVPVATDGIFILVANGTVTAGQKIVVDGNNSVADIGGSPAVINQVGHGIGRALTSTTSGLYCVVNIGA